MKAVFIDRDGTLGGDFSIEFPQDYYHYEGTREAVALLKENGFTPFAFTNQSCIARKKDGGYDFAAEFRDLGLEDWFICPHDSKDNCSCRKPKTGLLLKAREKYGLDMKNCFVIGDRWSDMKAGGDMGCSLILVLTGRGEVTLKEERHLWQEYEPDFVAQNILEAAKWMCNINEK